MATFPNKTFNSKCSVLRIPSTSIVMTVSILVLSLTSSADSLGEFCGLFGAECRADCGQSGAVHVRFEVCDKPLKCCFKPTNQQTNRGLPNPDLSGGQIPFDGQRYQQRLNRKPLRPVLSTLPPSQPPTPTPEGHINYVIPPPSVCGVRGHSRVRRIVNGVPAERCQYPWMVLLDRGPNPWDTCGASLISERHIITAAHCFGFVQTPVIIVGEYNKNVFRPRSEIRITKFKITLHPEFDNVHFVNDIAMITLDTPLDLSKYECLRPICLPDVNEDLSVGTDCRVLGWGSVQRVNEVGVVPRTASILQESTVQITRTSLCDRVWGKNYHRGSQICAGDMTGQTDSCLGDSGGPLMCSSMTNKDVFYLHGIVSLGSTPCAAPNTPALYTNVGKFKPWIEGMMAKSTG